MVRARALVRRFDQPLPHRIAGDQQSKSGSAFLEVDTKGPVTAIAGGRRTLPARHRWLDTTGRLDRLPNRSFARPVRILPLNVLAALFRILPFPFKLFTLFRFVAHGKNISLLETGAIALRDGSRHGCADLTQERPAGLFVSVSVGTGLIAR